MLELVRLFFYNPVLFIMYRLRSDDLETLEKEAEERIRLAKEAKKLKKLQEQ